MLKQNIDFPVFNGVRCLMMPYVQGDPCSVPEQYQSYRDIIQSVFIKRGDVGYLTIDELVVTQGKAHRGYRAKTKRALHTEAGLRPNSMYCWGVVPTWGNTRVTLDRDVEVLLANNVDNSCALWNATHEDTSLDGDIGDQSFMYPYKEAIMMKAGEVHKIGILTPHESLPVEQDVNRQFLRIISSGVHGREPYFTKNPVLS